jgi:hypothetical protein
MEVRNSIPRLSNNFRGVHLADGGCQQPGEMPLPSKALLTMAT